MIGRRALLGSILATPALAQAPYPSRAIRVIVPFAPGGATDFVARIVQPALQEILGQPLVIENRTGAAGNVGLEAAARLPADGYNLFFGNVGTLAVNPTVFARTIQAQPLRDFAPISMAGDMPDVLVVKNDLPARSVAELIALARAQPGKLNFGSPGAGSLNRLEMELLREAAGGLDMVHVPYPGGAGPAVLAIVAGDVDLLMTTLPSAMAQIQAGRIRALAVTSAARAPGLPEVPTLRESGFPDFVSGSWQGVLTPAGTPPEIVTRLHGAIVAAMQRPEVRQKLAAGGVSPDVSESPAAFAAFIGREAERWGSLATRARVSVD